MIDFYPYGRYGKCDKIVLYICSIMKKKIVIILFSLLSCGVLAQNIPQTIIFDPLEKEYPITSPLALWYTVYRLHISLGLGSSQDFSISSYSDLILSFKDVITYNIMDILEFSLDKDVVMNQYLSRLDSLLLLSDFAIANLKEDMSLLDYDINFCLSQKKISDQQYFDNINNPYQQKHLSTYLSESKKYAKCVSDNKIDYDAKKVLLDQIGFYSSIAKTKYNYLDKYKYDILSHYDLIKSDVLQELIIIKNMLEKYNY